MKVSNADRVVFPDDGITKGDVVDYYATVAEHLLPYLQGRALTVERFPKGIGGEGFMQKNAPDHAPDELIRRHQVPKEGGGTTTYPVIESVEAIPWFANLGVITFHAPTVTVDDEEHPDWAIWDLDPPDGRFDLARRAARALREMLDGLGISVALMTSGSKGYHLRARLIPGPVIDTASATVRGIAALAAFAHDDLMTVAFKKAERGERVFVDWLRNRPHATSVVPWSLRPRPGAPVAAPLAWDELDSVDPDDIRLGDIADRLDADPWTDVPEADLSLLEEPVGDALEAAGIALEAFDRFRS
jgi:bifunctional non-homologous end joining protein LigD